MSCLTPERFRELENADPSLEESNHINQCDYCCEGFLLYDDPDEFNLRIWKKIKEHYPEHPKPPKMRPKGDQS